MIVGVGLDVVHVSRLEHWKRVPGLLERYFHPEELAAALSRGSSSTLSLAARFAAKEAFGKAIGIGLRGITLKNILVVNNHNGKPSMRLSEMRLRHCIVREVLQFILALPMNGITRWLWWLLKEKAGKMKSDKKNSITFYSKEQIECPICGAHFKREELMTGGGRMIAGKLTEELHRLYEPSTKYGEIFPLVYTMTVCPKCHYSAFPQDFNILDKESLNRIYDNMQDRYESIRNLFSSVNFASARTLSEGAASYYLAMLCYEYVSPKYSPTIKQGVCALRAAWLFEELEKKYPEENYGYMVRLFYRKALFFYRRSVELESTGQEMIANMKSFGPDVDKNYGYDGVLYLCALLETKYGSRNNPEQRRALLTEQRRSLAKMFGLGKSSKTKPGPLLEHARALYENIVAELNEEEDGDDQD